MKRSADTRAISWITPKIAGETNGAIMVMGVFMACSLIAAMWYVMGVGDAILWRDRSQEAADAVAYTSAAVHARGMNFISAMNIVMLVITALYIVMCIGRSVLDIVLYITGDPWDSTCNPLGGLGDTTGHGIISFAGGIPPMSFLSGFGIIPPGQFTRFLIGGDPPRYRRSDLAGIWGPLSDADALLTGAGLRDYIWNGSICGPCVTSLVDVAVSIPAIAAGGVGVVSGLAGLAAAVATCGLCILACESDHPFEAIGKPAAKAYKLLETKMIQPYEKYVMKPTLPALHTAEKFVAQWYTTPVAGMIAGAYAGWKYQEQMSGTDSSQVAHRLGLALSPSMFPDLKAPDKVKKLKPDCAQSGGSPPDCLEYLDYEGNGCGPTLCTDGKASHSGPYKDCASSDPKQCDGKTSTGKLISCCTRGESGCRVQGVCASGKKGVSRSINNDQSGLYQEVSIPKNRRYGLPVEAVNMNELCQKVVAYTGEMIEGLFSSLLGGTPLAGVMSKKIPNIPGLPGRGKTVQEVIDGIIQSIAQKFKVAYCVGDEDKGGDLAKLGPSEGARHSKDGYEEVLDHNFWYVADENAEKNGPMKMVDYAQNGNDWLQVWAVSIPQYYNWTRPEYGNKASGNSIGAWSKLRLAVGPKEWSKSDYDDNPSLTCQGTECARINFYISEAEFYHDCEGTWDDTTCNGDDHAVYRLNWRTRLRRVRKPKWLQEAVGKVPMISTLIKGTNFIVKHEAQINEVMTDMFGLTINGPLDVVETINALGSQGNLMPPIYH